MVDNVILDVFQGKIALRDSGEAFDPIFNVELFSCDVLRHRNLSPFNSRSVGIA
jgi:hypothetical protein